MKNYRESGDLEIVLLFAVIVSIYLFAIIVPVVLIRLIIMKFLILFGIVSWIISVALYFGLFLIFLIILGLLK